MGFSKTTQSQISCSTVHWLLFVNVDDNGRIYNFFIENTQEF